MAPDDTTTTTTATKSLIDHPIETCINAPTKTAKTKWEFIQNIGPTDVTKSPEEKRRLHITNAVQDATSDQIISHIDQLKISPELLKNTRVGETYPVGIILHSSEGDPVPGREIFCQVADNQNFVNLEPERVYTDEKGSAHFLVKIVQFSEIPFHISFSSDTANISICTVLTTKN